MNSLKKNFTYNLIYQVFTILMPLVTAPYLARILGATGLGMYSYTFTVAEYFLYFAMLGVANYGNRTIAATPSKEKSKTFIEIYSVQFLVSIFVFVLYIFFATFINKKYKILTYIQSFYVLSSAFDITWYFWGNEKFRSTTIRNVAVKLSALILIFCVVKSSEDIWKYALIMSLSYLISQLMMWVYIPKEIHYVKPSKKLMVQHLKSMLVLFIPVIAITLYKMMDKIMLEALGSVTEVGYYESAEKIVRVPALVITALGTSMLPRMSKMGSLGQEDKMKQYFGLSTEFAGLLAFGMAFGLVSVADLFIPIYYGIDFQPSILLLQMLSINLFFTSWASAIRNQYLLPMKYDKEYIVSVFVGAFCNLILNSLLIPSLGAMGAIIATIVAEASVAIVQTIAVKNELRITKYLVRYSIYLLPGLIMYMFLRLIKPLLGDGLISLGMMIIIGSFVYFAFALILMQASKSKLLFVIKQQALKSRRR